MIFAKNFCKIHLFFDNVMPPFNTKEGILDVPVRPET